MDNNAGKIFLGGLPRNCTEETLTQYFTKFGEIMETTLVRDNETGNPRGFGFIKFKDPDSVATALAAGQHTIDGKRIDAKPLRQKSYSQGGNYNYSNAGGPMGGGGGGYGNRNNNSFGGRGGMMRGPQGERRAPGGDGGVGSQRPAVGDHPFKIFVGGLPRQGADENMLRDYFSQYGTVTDILLPTDRETRQPKGYAFITYESEKGAASAASKRFQDILNKKVEVKRCENRDRNQQRMHDASNNFMQYGFGGGSSSYGGNGGGGGYGQGGPGYGHGGGGSSGYQGGGYGYDGHSNSAYSNQQGGPPQGQPNMGSFPGYSGGGFGYQQPSMQGDSQAARGGGPGQMMGAGGMFNQGGQQSAPQPQQFPQGGQPGSNPAPFNMGMQSAGGGNNPQALQQQQQQSAAYAQYASLWYAMQQQQAAAQGTAGAASAPTANSATAAVPPAMGGATGQGDVSGNYQHYLAQYHQQNANASQSTLAAMGGTGQVGPPMGVPPPNVPGTSQGAAAAGGAPNMFNMPGYQQSGAGGGAPGAVAPFGQMGGHAGAPQNAPGQPTAAGASSTSDVYANLYAQYIASINSGSSAAASGGGASAPGR